MASSTLIHKKLEDFLRKYYLNELVKGGIIVAGLVCAIILVYTLSEHLFYFETGVRAFFFYSFIVGTLGTIGWFVIRPLSALFKLSKRLTYENAALLIGNHFSEVKDKLLNTLQLEEQSKNNSSDLILADIEQRSSELSPIPFSSAINKTRLFFWFKTLGPVIFVLMLVWLINPTMISGSSFRIINHSSEFVKPAPFDFNLKNKTLQILQGEDFNLELEITGDIIPNEVFVLMDGGRQKTEKLNTITFVKTFPSIQQSKTFYFSANGFKSKTYKIEVLAKPTLSNLTIEVVPPMYTKLKSFKENGSGDLTVAEGSTVRWYIVGENLDSVFYKVDSSYKNFEKTTTQFLYSSKPRASCQYALVPYNSNITKGEIEYPYTLAVIKDEYPFIKTTIVQDSLLLSNTFFSGVISDDYGFSNLSFFYFEKDESSARELKIPLAQVSPNGEFYFSISSDSFPSKSVNYFFQVVDNDKVNGPKATRTTIAQLSVPTASDLDKKKTKESEKVKKGLEEALNEAADLAKELKKLNEKLVGKKNLSFEEKQQIQDLLNKQSELKNTMQEIAKQNEKSNKLNNKKSKGEERIQEKQKQLEKMFNESFDPELQELLKKLSEDLEKNKPPQEDLEKMELSNQDLEEELDRMLELYKKLEFEQELNNLADELQKLAEKEETLSEETKNAKTDEEKAEIKAKQEKIQEELERLKEKAKKLDKLNEELEVPTEFESPQDKMDEAGDSMEEGNEKLDKGDNQGSSESQKDAAEKMKKMGEEMAKMAASMEGKALNVNIKALREILENLIAVSFEQESLIDELKGTRTIDPQYLEITQKQKKLSDDMLVLKDSLISLSKKVVEIETFIMREIADIEREMKATTKLLADRNINNASSSQQFLLTSVNNIGLLLSEILDNLQEQMMQSQQGAGKPSPGNQKSPGKSGKTPSLGKLGELQDQLNKQMKEGGSKGEEGEGKGEGQGQGGQSQKLAQMAAKQQAIRNAIQQLNKDENKNGGAGGGFGDLEKLQELMEQTESDIVNKKITQETLKRQEDIRTRLLEAEKAERQREQDPNRESKEGSNFIIENGLKFEEYERQQNSQLDLIKKRSLKLNPYYSNKIAVYFEEINKLEK
ncbi:MAG: hypothetical protein ACJAZ3_001565 [Sphingobacteriales bacterium]|jgi:hypothetical protein